MLRHLSGASVIALCLATAAAAQEAHDHAGEESVTLYRVFVGDHEAPRVTALDLADPANRWTFGTKGQAKLYSEADGAVIVAAQSFDDQVNFIASGVSLHDHGEHQDIEIADPEAIAVVLEGPRPFHVLGHDGKLAINFDAGGYAEILDEHALSEGRVEAVRFPQAHAHHGVVVPMGDIRISSVASEEPVEAGTLPPRVGAQVFAPDGEPAGELATCSGLHGEAFSGAYLVFGCDEGVLTVIEEGDAPVFRMLPYPADFPKGETTGTLLGVSAVQMFLGNHGKTGLVVIDPAGEPHMRRIELPFRRVDFVLDPARPAHGYVLTEDGTLHRVNMLNAEIEASARVTEHYSMDGDWNLPRPRLAMAGDEIVMTDPNAGLVRRIATADMSELGTIPVEGKPYNIAVAGGTGVVE